MSINRIRTNSVTGSYLAVDWYVKKRDIRNNYSTIHYTLKGQRDDGRAGYYRTLYDVQFSINNQTKINRSIRRKIYHGTVITEGDINIWHKNDGTQNFNITVKGGFGTSSGFNVSNSQNFTLEKIPRWVKIIKALDRVDGEQMAFVIDNSANQNYKITLKDIKSNRVLKTLEHQWGSGWVNFQIDHNQIYNLHPRDKQIELLYEIYTYSSNHTETKKINYKIVNTKPSISGNISLKDQWNRLKDNGNGIVQRISYPYIDANGTTFTPSKGATISTVSIFAQGLSKVERYNPSQKTFVFENRFHRPGNTTAILRITDSRGFTADKITYSAIVPYTPPIIYADLVRKNNFEQLTSFKISVKSFKLRGNNRLTYIKYRYKENGGNFNDFQNLEVTNPKETNTLQIYTIPEFFKNLDNTKKWTVEIVAKDEFLTSTKHIEVDKGEPLMFLSTTEKNLRVNNKRVILEDDPVITELKKSTKGAIQIDINRDTDINSFTSWSNYRLEKLPINKPHGKTNGDSLVHESWGITVKRNMHAVVSGQLAFKNLGATGKTDYYVEIHKEHGGADEPIYKSVSSEVDKWIGVLPFTFLEEFTTGDKLRFYVAIKGSTAKKHTILENTFLLAKEI